MDLHDGMLAMTFHSYGAQKKINETAFYKHFVPTEHSPRS